MRRAWWSAAVVVALSGCDFLPGGGGGTGGGGAGGGGGGQDFTRGFVFVRHDDKNVYLSDQADFMAKSTLTTQGGAKHPSLSADGKKVVFVRSTGTGSELATVPVGGGMVSTVMASSATVKNLRHPVFTPDGSRVVFSYDDGAASSVGVVDAVGTGFARLSGGGALSYSGATLYPDGSAVLAAAGNAPSMLTALERVSLSTGMATSVTNTLGNEAMGITGRVVVSPDGSKAAFEAKVGSGSVRIFVIDLSSKVVSQLTDYPGEPGAMDSSPCWVGNDKVGFSSDTGGNESIYALPATGIKTSGGLQVAGGAEPWFGPN